MKKEFNIDNYNFRVTKITPIEMVTLHSQIDFNTMKPTIEAFTFILEHIEVKIGDVWTLVKEKGREVYAPESIPDKLWLLDEIIFTFLMEVLRPLFKKSEELNHQPPSISPEKK